MGYLMCMYANDYDDHEMSADTVQEGNEIVESSLSQEEMDKLND